MIDITMCDSCTHVKVCGKKDNYEKYSEALGRVCISPSDHKIMYAKDDADISVDLKCKYYEKFIPLRVK